ncbi:MAG TPA: hypothetical protein VG253_18820 [Streptosporangiaceae bacterium]|nr:hypothetical protein [Streptosporangiaceae bacterium]
MTPVIWLSVTVASVVAACVIRFGNTRDAHVLSCSRPCPPSPAGGCAAAAGRQLQGGASSQVSVMCSL